MQRTSKNSRIETLYESFKPLIESTMRKIIREEMEYYMEKYMKRSENVTSITSPNRIENKNTVRESVKKTNPQLQNRLQNTNSILSKIVFEDTAPFDAEDSEEFDNSILSEKRMNVLANDPKLRGVYDALNKDYSSMIKAMDNN